MTKSPAMETDIFELSEKARTGLLVLAAQKNISPTLAIQQLVEEAAKNDFSFIRVILSTKDQPQEARGMNRPLTRTDLMMLREENPETFYQLMPAMRIHVLPGKVSKVEGPL